MTARAQKDHPYEINNLGNEKVLKHCQTESFMVNDEYYFVTTGVEESKDESSKLSRFKSILNI